MKKYMKFTMFYKETEDEKDRDDPYRAVKFPINENGRPVRPGGKNFIFLNPKSQDSPFQVNLGFLGAVFLQPLCLFSKFKALPHKWGVRIAKQDFCAA